MIDKVFKRFKEPNLKRDKEQATEWCESQAIGVEEFCKRLDEKFFEESLIYSGSLHQRVKEKLEQLPVKMGGGGDVFLTYFLARYLKPEVIVETGVSMGFTSTSFLEAIALNESGELYSSDFPYFRIENPEKYIGWIVPNQLKKGWHLFIKGDKINLKDILKKVSKVDLFHYDSDKSYAGRIFAWEMVKQKLADGATIVFDDIGDNAHFKKEFFDKGIPSQVLRARRGGFIGIVGDIIQPSAK